MSAYRTLGAIVLLCAFSVSAFAQPSILIGDEVVPAGGNVDVDLNFVGDGTVTQLNFRFTYDADALTADISGCGDGNSTVSPGQTACNIPELGEVAVVHSNLSATALADGTFGSVNFTAAADAQPGLRPLEFSVQSFSNAAGGAVAPVGSEEGSVTIEGPFLLFDPASDETVDTGSAEVGDGTSNTILVTEAGTDDVRLQSCDIAGGNAGDFSFVYSGQDAPLPAAFDGGEAQTGQIEVTCTPSARGTRTSTLSCEVQDALDNSVTQTPSWPLTCAGLSPNVDVQPPAASVAVVNQPGSSASATYTISNEQDDFTSSADNVAVSIAPTGPGPVGPEPTVAVNPAAFASIPAAGSETFDASCEADADTTLGTYTFDVTVTFDDPSVAGDGSITVEFTCEVAEERPGYTSDPAPGSTLDFGQVRNQDTSDSEIILVGNENSIGDGEFAELDVTDAQVTGADAANFAVVGFAPFSLPPGAANGSGSIEVQCTPQSIGVFVAVLEVTSNDPDSPHTYPLECEGITSATLQSSPPPPGGTLNLGIGNPGDTLFGSINFTNGGVDDLSLNCELTDDAGGVITADPDPAVFVIDADGSESISFQCNLPDEIDTFSGTLSCTTNDPDFPEGVDYTILCQVRPLVVPTANTWGLMILALMLLLAGGLFGRRLLAARA